MTIKVKYILPPALLRVKRIIPSHPIYEWLFESYTSNNKALIEDIKHTIYELPPQCRWRVLQSAITDVFMTKVDMTDTTYIS